MQAKCGYDSGNWLRIPAQGFAPLLFLEFLRDTERAITVQIKKDTTEDSGYLLIRMPNALRETFLDARDYINANLPDDGEVNTDHIFPFVKMVIPKGTDAHRPATAP